MTYNYDKYILKCCVYFFDTATDAISVIILLNYMNCKFYNDYSSQKAYLLMFSNDICTL